MPKIFCLRYKTNTTYLKLTFNEYLVIFIWEDKEINTIVFKLII